MNLDKVTMTESEKKFEEICADSIICSLLNNRKCDQVFVCISYKDIPIFIEINEENSLKQKKFAILDVDLNESRYVYGINNDDQKEKIIFSQRIENYLSYLFDFWSVFSEYDPDFQTNGIEYSLLNLTNYIYSSQKEIRDILFEIHQKLCGILNMPFCYAVSTSKSLLSIMINNLNSKKIDSNFNVVEEPYHSYEIPAFIGDININSITGLNKKKIQILNSNNIKTIHDIVLKRCLISFLFSRNFCQYIFSCVVGVDLNISQISHFSKSCILHDSTNNIVSLSKQLRIISEKLTCKLHRFFLPIKYIKLKLVYGKNNISKEIAIPYYSMEFNDIFAFSNHLLNDIFSAEIKNTDIYFDEIVLFVYRHAPIQKNKRQVSLHNWLVKNENSIDTSLTPNFSQPKNQTNKKSSMTMDCYFKKAPSGSNFCKSSKDEIKSLSSANKNKSSTKKERKYSKNKHCSINDKMKQKTLTLL